MKTDRELLELAAKACGFDWREEFPGAPQLLIFSGQEPGGSRWNPLDDDGDALRLAVKLQLWLRYRDASLVNVCWYDVGGFFAGNVVYALGEGGASSVRRAIVLAAAAIGEAMP